MNSPRQPLSALLLSGLLLFIPNVPAQAGSATWNLNPTNGDWNTSTNWTPASVPNGSSDTATFAFSNRTGVSFSAFTEVNGIVFNAGASAFTIIASPSFSLTISGVGITNNSGIVQNFVHPPHGGGIFFRNSATAGSGTFFNNTGCPIGPACPVEFFDTSTAGNSTFTNNGGDIGRDGAFMDFFNTSTAGNGTFINTGSKGGGTFGGIVTFFDSSTAGTSSFTNNGSVSNGNGAGGIVNFANHSTAGNATFTNNGGAVSSALGGRVNFQSTSDAGHGIFTNNGAAVSDASGGSMSFAETSGAANAILIANDGPAVDAAGRIQFDDRCGGGKARVEVFGNGNLDISFHDAPGVTTGSIEGSGLVFLGANNLTVGSNNLSTAFSGVIQDGGLNGGAGGSLTKTGKGKLTLSKGNTYTGGTTVSQGTLLVTNKTGSGTGTGAVQVNAWHARRHR